MVREHRNLAVRVTPAVHQQLEDARYALSKKLERRVSARELVEQLIADQLAFFVEKHVGTSVASSR